MTRPLTSTPFGRWLLPGTVALLVLLAILPVSWIRWMGGVGTLVRVLVAPIAQPLTSLGAAARRAGVGEIDPRDHEQVVEEAKHWRFLFQQQAMEIERLRVQVQDLQRGLAIDPDLPIRQIKVDVISRSADSVGRDLNIRGGHNKGVSVGAVAVASGTQLLGKVIDVADRISIVRPITRGGASLRARIMIDEPNVSYVVSVLSPTDDGRLRGDVEYGRDAAGTPLEPEVGQSVRLADDTWPRSAQGLVVGIVERVENDESTGLRKVVLVRPTIDLESVAEVYLRLTFDETSRPVADAKEIP